ncbi:unnamed protein product [Dicrocoelium dendriticum]|nr:unnamed protein product [Dicrocoelium dendriticum]
MNENANGTYSPFRWHELQKELPTFGTSVKFFLLTMNSSIFLWIGDVEGTFSSLSVCVPERDSKTLCSSHIYGTAFHGVPGASLGLREEMLSRKISKRFQVPVYLSLSLSPSLEALWDQFNLCAQATLSEAVEEALFTFLLRTLQSEMVTESSVQTPS